MYNENATKYIIIEKLLIISFFAFLKIKEIEDMKKNLQANQLIKRFSKPLKIWSILERNLMVCFLISKNNLITSIVVFQLKKCCLFLYDYISPSSFIILSFLRNNKCPKASYQGNNLWSLNACEHRKKQNLNNNLPNLTNTFFF